MTTAAMTTQMNTLHDLLAFKTSATASDLNTFYKHHGYEGRMSPADTGVTLANDAGIVAALRLIHYPGEVRIRHLFTALAHRQQGLASHLLSQTVLHTCNEPTRITLICAAPLAHFYCRNGFSPYPVDTPSPPLTRTEHKLIHSGRYQLMHYQLMHYRTGPGAG